ncbi:MAG: hypothetical protein AAF125_06620, partial [Chloroflexota bacterium]
GESFGGAMDVQYDRSTPSQPTQPPVQRSPEASNSGNTYDEAGYDSVADDMTPDWSAMAGNSAKQQRPVQRTPESTARLGESLTEGGSEVDGGFVGAMNVQYDRSTPSQPITVQRQPAAKQQTQQPVIQREPESQPAMSGMELDSVFDNVFTEPDTYDDSAFTWDAADWSQVPEVHRPAPSSSAVQAQPTPNRTQIQRTPDTSDNNVDIGNLSGVFTGTVQRETADASIGYFDDNERFPSEPPQQDLFSALSDIGWNDMGTTNGSNGAHVQRRAAEAAPPPGHEATGNKFHEGMSVEQAMRAIGMDTERWMDSNTNASDAGAGPTTRERVQRTADTPSHSHFQPNGVDKLPVGTLRYADVQRAPSTEEDEAPPSESDDDCGGCGDKNNVSTLVGNADLTNVDMNKLTADVYAYVRRRLRVEYERRMRR